MTRFLYILLLVGVGNMAYGDDYLVVIPPNVDLGSGYSSLGGLYLQGKAKSQCVEKGAGSSSIGGLKGSIIQAEISILESMEKMRLKYDESTNYTGSIKFAKAAGSAKMQAGISVGEESYSMKKDTLALIKIRKTYQPLNLNSYKVSEGALELFSDHPEKFYEICGDEFVSSITVGAEVHALITCHNEEAEEKQKLDRFIAGNAGYMDSNVNGKFKSTLEQINEKSNGRCGIQVLAFGGAGAPVSAKIETFVETALNYIAEGKPEDGFVVSIATTPYRNVISKDFHEKVLEQAGLNLEKQTAYVKSLREMIAFFYSQAVLLDPSYAPHQERLRKLRQTIQVYRSDIERCAIDPFSPHACARRGSSMQGMGSKLFSLFNK